MRVDTQYIIIDPQATTGISTILVDDQGENSIVVTAGANYCVTEHEIDRIDGLFSTTKYLVFQLEIPLYVVEYAIRKARKNNVRIILNNAPAYPSAKELLSAVDYLLLNETEAQVCTGRNIEKEQDTESAVRDLLSLGVPVVVLTLGNRGALFGADNRVTRIPTWDVNVVDTTVARDAFTVGFTVALSNGESLEEAGKYANAVGALTVTRLGTQTSLPSAVGVQDLMVTH